MRKSTVISFVFLTCLATVLLAFAQDAGPQLSQISIDIRDYCDPTTFNAVIGAGTCVRDTSPGAITFPGFLAEFVRDKSVGAWRFVPNQIRAHEGATLTLQNLGGETHTFTRVKRFGGGFVSVLNFLPPAPECLRW